MHQTIITTTTKLLVYIGILYTIDILFSNYILISTIITVIIILILDNKFHSLLYAIIVKRFYPSVAYTEKYLSEFNISINGIVEYWQLLNEYYNLFDKIFEHPSWAFYVLEKNTFMLQKSNISNPKATIPTELNFEEFDFPELYVDLQENPDHQALKNKHNIDTILSSNLDILIPVPGKNQIIALLLTNKKNIQIFRNSSLKELGLRILQKSGIFLENTALFLDLSHRNLEIKKLFEVSEKLLSSFNTNEILEFILSVLDEVIPYDAAVIFLLDSQSGDLLQKASKGYGEKSDELSMKIDQGACGWVARNKEISIIDDVKFAEDYFPIREYTQSQIALPLIIHNETLGVLCLEKNEIAYFTKNLIELLNVFANQAAIALYNAKQYEISLAKRSLEHELINAGKVQQVLLPKRAPYYKNLDISFANIPSKIVSGDLYDLIPMDDHHLGIMIGDVAGKGAGAAIMMSLLLAGFRAYKKTRFTVCETVARLNNLLEESLSASRYATFFYGILSLEKHNITFTNAGHNPPILLHKDGTTEDLFGGGIVLGYLANETYTQQVTSFSKGDLMVLYTDGITETMNEDSQEFGVDRLLNVIKQNFSKNSYEIKRTILEELKKFTGQNEPDDDATLIVIKHL